MLRHERLYFSLNAFGEASMKWGAIMDTPIQKEFGPGYDYPNRRFNFWAVILPTVVLVALAVVLMRDVAGTRSKATRSPIVTCPKQMCPAPASPSASPVLSVTRAMLSQSSSAVTHAVVLSSA
jgi:hypothetical protein